MWVSKKKWNCIEKRIEELEKAVETLQKDTAGLITVQSRLQNDIKCEIISDINNRAIEKSKTPLVI